MPTHDDRAVRNGGDDQVADTCFRFLVPTKERFPGAQRLSARRAIRAYPREADYYVNVRIGFNYVWKCASD